MTATRPVVLPLFTALAAAGSPALAAPTVDGTLDVGEYGLPLAVQQNATTFGDNTLPGAASANGQELDNAYGLINAGSLYLFLGGNIAANNAIDLFIDNVSGVEPGGGPAGSSTIRVASGETLSSDYVGFTFDEGFTPETYIQITTPANGVNDSTITVSYEDLLAEDEFSATQGVVGTTQPTFGTLIGGNVLNGDEIDATVDNSNLLGVTSASAVGAAAVTTGLEYRIDLSLLGGLGDEYRVTALLNTDSGGFLSNQLLGSLPAGSGSLGSDVGGTDLSAIAGEQFFTVRVPEPASTATLLLGAAALLRRRGGR